MNYIDEAAEAIKQRWFDAASAFGEDEDRVARALAEAAEPAIRKDERSKVEARAVCLRERATQNRQEATRFEIEAKEVGSREDASRMTLRATMLRDFAAILEDEAAALKVSTEEDS